MKRYICYLLMPALMLLASCHKDDPTIPTEPQRYGRTVLVYMAMQNSLGSSKYHKADSAEIANGMQYIPENDRLLLFIDDKEKPRIYELNSQLAKADPKTGLPYGPKLLKRWDTDLSSASGATLTEVLKFMRDNYFSESYGLVMGSHATGWMPAKHPSEGQSARRAADGQGAAGAEAGGRRKTFGIDVGTDGSMVNDHGVGGSQADEMNIEDLAKAIAASGVHPYYILFDACLMQNIEVDYALRNATDYIIASPISISAEGAYYTDLVRKGLFSGSAVDVATTYADYYNGRGSIPYTDSYGTVISCVRTAMLENFAYLMRHALHSVSGFAGTSAEELTAHMMQANMDEAFYYHPYCSNFYYRPHYYDLVSACMALGVEAPLMSQLRQALSEVVTYYDATSSFWIGPGYYKFQTVPDDRNAWCGVSMFVPQRIYAENAERCTYGDLNEAYKATEWFKTVYGGQ